MILSVRHAIAERVEVAHPTVGGVQAWRVGNRVGESPVWDDSTGRLLWIDVRAPAVLRLDPRSSAVTRWALPEVVGALALAEPGSLVLALTRRLATLDLDRGRLRLGPAVAGEPATNRLNDGKVSRSGRWFVFGSMDDRPVGKQPTGALYRVGAAGDVRCLQRGLAVCNGIEWSPDGGTLYFSDSHAGRIWHAPWHEADGTIGEARRFAEAGEAVGRPDGAAVDAAGDYWSAGVSAACVNRFAADGRLRSSLALPCRAPTMPCFGGDGLATLFVTSLVRPDWPTETGSLDGALFAVPTGTPGLPASRWMP